MMRLFTTRATFSVLCLLTTTALLTACGSNPLNKKSASKQAAGCATGEPTSSSEPVPTVLGSDGCPLPPQTSPAPVTTSPAPIVTGTNNNAVVNQTQTQTIGGGQISNYGQTPVQTGINGYSNGSNSGYGSNAGYGSNGYSNTYGNGYSNTYGNSYTSTYGSGYVGNYNGYTANSNGYVSNGTTGYVATNYPQVVPVGPASGCGTNGSYCNNGGGQVQYPPYAVGGGSYNQSDVAACFGGFAANGYNTAGQWNIEVRDWSSVSVLSGSNFTDSSTDHALVIVQSVNVLSGMRLNLLNPNALYCIRNVSVLSAIQVNSCYQSNVVYGPNVQVLTGNNINIVSCQ